MKRHLSVFLLLTTLFVFTLGSSGQPTLVQKDPAGVVSTVNTNADTSYHTITLAGSVNNYELLTFVVAGTKTSGTVAGAVTLWGSLDNSRWFAITDTAGLGSQALTDGDTNFKWDILGTRWVYYRIRVITSGTQVSSYVCRLLGRKHPY